jgi:hypothetical protein
MRFDKFDRSYEDTLKEEAATAEASLDPVPDGDRDFEIRKVKWIEKLGKVVIDFATASGSFQWVQVWLNPADQKDHDRAMVLLHALGLPEDTDIDESLVGRFVMLTTKQAFKNGEAVFEKDGRHRVYVNGIARSKLTITEKKAEHKPQTAAARVAAARGDEAGGEDDIPF